MLRRTTPRAPEHGFTLVELVIGMVLLVLVIGGVVSAISQLGQGNASLTANRKAQREALDALEQMRQDISSARSPALTSFDDRREVLRELVSSGVDDGTADPANVSRTTCGGGRPARGSAYVACLRTFTVASGNELWFRADVDASTPDYECVGYRRLGMRLTRYVSRNWRGCGPAAAAGAVATDLVKGDISTPTRNNAFGYTLRRNPAASRAGYVDPRGCATSVAPASGTAPAGLPFIASVEIDLSVLTRHATAAASGGLDTRVAVTSHTNGDYAFATGCGT